jgi:integrative and conjugative element protein (TIGR02256 family)
MWRRHQRVVDCVWIVTAVFHQIIAESAEHAPLETGGMLLGYEGTDAAGTVITALVGHGPLARHARGRFIPDGPWQQEELERIYGESGRVTTYLGDWHSHPNSPPFPSRRDRRTARTVARTRHARAPRPLTVIAGSTADGEWTVAAHIFVGRSFQPLRIRLF